MSDLVGERGYVAFAAAALDLGWIVRRQHESDQGIDAQVEMVEHVQRKRGPAKSVATGRLLAVQIKGGRSWFKRPTKSGGWWFSFTERERNLWLNHALPVLVALYDPDSDEVYWQRISASTVSKARTKYRVEVPQSQTVAMAGPEWAELATGREQRAEARFELSLQALPPVIADVLGKRSSAERPAAAMLAMHLAEGRLNPRGTAASLLSSRPAWISDNGRWAWSLVAHYCSDHDQNDLAADGYELAAQANDGDGRLRALVAASTHRLASDRVAAQELLRVAEQEDSEPVLRAVARTVVNGFDELRGRWSLDPLLVTGGAGVDGHAAAQRLLSSAARATRRHDDAVRHAESALSLEENSSQTMVLLADCLLGRWSLQGAAVADLLRAIELLTKALSQRKAWAGPVESIRRDLARSLAMAGNFDELLALALPPPFGNAAAEDLDPIVLRVAIRAAYRTGQYDARDQVALLLGNTPEDRLALAASGAVELPGEEMIELRLRGFEDAVASEDYESIAELGLALSVSGIDVVDSLTPYVERGILPEALPRLCSALVTIPTQGLDASLPSLREMAKTDGIAAEYLLGALSDANRHAEAATQARQLFEVTNSANYLIHEAQALIRAGDSPRAVESATQAIALTDIRTHDRADLLVFLGGAAGEGGDWALGERYLSQAVDLIAHPGDSTVWNLVICQINQGRIAKAAQTIGAHKPKVRTTQDAELWLRAHAGTRWDERTAFEAFALAQRFDDPQLSTALVSAIVTRTHGVSDEDDDQEVEDELAARRLVAQAAVPGELHRQAFELIERLVATYGDQTGMQVMSGSDDELLEQMLSQLQAVAAADAARSDLVVMAREGRIPLGLVATAFKRGHTTLEAQRVLGYRMAASVVDDEHASEIDAATSAFNATVVVDASTVLTLTAIPQAELLAGRLLGLTVPPSLMLDLHRFSDDVRGMAGSPGSMRWDDELGGPVFTALPDEEFMRLLRRAEAVEAYLDRLAVRVCGPSTVYKDLRRNDLSAPWMDVLQLAADSDALVWSDDLGMRRAARAVGIQAFGTPALVDAIRDDEIARSASIETDTASIRQACERTLDLARDHVVDLVLRETDALVLAEEQGWEPRAGAVAIARPSFWGWNDKALSVVQAIYAEVRVNAPDSLPAWQVAAMQGAARVAQAETAAAILAMLALAGFSEEPSDQERADGLRRARRVATDLELPDPVGGLPRAAQLLAAEGGIEQPAELVKRILDLVEPDVDP